MTSRMVRTFVEENQPRTQSLAWVRPSTLRIIRSYRHSKKCSDSKTRKVLQSTRVSAYSVQKLVKLLIDVPEELKRLYIGQSLDLHWTCNMICPSVNEYLSMVENSK